VFEILLRFNLESAFCAWRTQTRALKRHELALLDLTDLCATNIKRARFKHWLQRYRETHAKMRVLKRYVAFVYDFMRTLRIIFDNCADNNRCKIHTLLFIRFGRVLGWKGHTQMRKFFKRWEGVLERTKQYAESGSEIAKLRNELCNLKATLHDLTNKDEVASSLAAERSLNRYVPAVLFFMVVSTIYASALHFIAQKWLIG
jgi:hypothetical protein